MQDIVDISLIEKYNKNAPRYTSYPTALSFNDEFKQHDFVNAVTHSATQDLSLYVHIPFCHSLCYYCGCNKIVTRHQDKADVYLDYLEKEVQHQQALFGRYKVRQVHLGGGSPSFLTPKQLKRLMTILRTHFNFIDDIEMSIEIDPRRIQLDYVDHLYQEGFNRLSIGLQDTNEKVQLAINRPQCSEFIAKLIQRAKQLGFKSVNVDLIYGLPHQNNQTFGDSLEEVMAMRPERISLFSYAHLPARFAAQRKILDHWLPSAQGKLQLMLQAIKTLTAAGYEFIGLDHFALPDDELAKAQKAGLLHRNFQGYTTQGECDLLGLGVSSISSIGKSFSQNAKELKHYYAQIEEQGHALNKGVTLTQDDVIRGYVIKEIMCNGRVYKPEIEQRFKINFGEYFADSLAQLDTFVADGLLLKTEESIELLPKGRLLVRNIAMAFDAYAQHDEQQQRFSKVI